MTAPDVNTQRWKYASASVMGTSHVRTGDPCQDACACEVIEAPDGSDILLVVACDGAGSARLSQIGSVETCRFIIRRIKELITTNVSVAEITHDVTTKMILDAREHLRELAQESGVTVRDLACTLVAAIVATDAATFFQVGDGVAVIGPRNDPINEFCWVFWPERGEYANTTTFLSDERLTENIQHTSVFHGIDEIAVLTDGIQNLVLDYKEMAAHSPFFSRMMIPLRGTAGSGHIESLSSALASYLDSQPINERTDDDKTLVLASRRTT